MATPTFKEKLGTWDAMSQNLRDCLAEVPYLTEDQAALEELLAQGHSLEAQQAVFLASLREVNRRRAELERQGDVLRNRLAGALRHKFGETSTRLIAFGLKPKAERRRRLSPEQKAEQLARRQKRAGLLAQKIERQQQKLAERKKRLAIQAFPNPVESPPESL